MKRFNDPVLVTILEKMRRTNGAKLSEQEWQALLNTELDASKIERDPVAFLRDTAGWYESSYLWSIVSMASYTRAKASARCQQRTLIFCQATDFCEQLGQRGQRDKQLYKEMLAVPSVAQTSRLPGMVLLHIGMRARITTQVLPPWAVQDATGTVMEIDACYHDQQQMASSGDGHPEDKMVDNAIPNRSGDTHPAV